MIITSVGTIIICVEKIKDRMKSFLRKRANRVTPEANNPDFIPMQNRNQEQQLAVAVPKSVVRIYNTTNKNPALMNSMGIILCVAVYFSIVIPMVVLYRNISIVTALKVTITYLSLSVVPSLIVPTVFYVFDVKQFKTFGGIF